MLQQKNKHGLPEVKPEQLDHVIHAMRLDGKLQELTTQQIKNIIYALQTAGHLDTFLELSHASYNDGALISFHNADFLNDLLFKEAYELGKSTYTDPKQVYDIRWRIHNICWAATLAKKLEGDFVECGVNYGWFSRAAMHYIHFQEMTDRKFYLFDTFCGIPVEDHHLAPEYYRDYYHECYSETIKNFAKYPNAILVRGKVPETLTTIVTNKVCYLSLDMNHAEPEIAAAEFFWDKLVTGAPIILDDYGAYTHERQKSFFDKFARRKGVPILQLPTCQGLIIKP